MCLDFLIRDFMRDLLKTLAEKRSFSYEDEARSKDLFYGLWKPLRYACFRPSITHNRQYTRVFFIREVI